MAQEDAFVGNTVKQSNTAPTVTPAAPVSTELQTLIQLMAQREARQIAKEVAEEKAREVRDAQREKNSKNHVQSDLLRQARCTHLKGGRKGPRSQVRDFAVYMHTYINTEAVIRCFICKMSWKTKDTVEFLYRHGKKIANHTKIGWAEAVKMLEQSTNSPSSSEIPYQNAQPVGTPSEE